MPNLLLDEQWIKAVLDQMSHIRMPQTMRMQRRIQPKLITVLGEPHPDVAAGDPRLAFGRP